MEIHNISTLSCVRPGLIFKTKEFDVAANIKTKNIKISNTAHAQGYSKVLQLLSLFCNYHCSK